MGSDTSTLSSASPEKLMSVERKERSHELAKLNPLWLFWLPEVILLTIFLLHHFMEGPSAQSRRLGKCRDS